VREATLSELDAAGAAVRAAYAVGYHGPASYLDVLADARARALDACVAVAVDSAGQVLGSVTFALPGSRWSELATDGEAEFRMLGVLPSHHGLGVGAALTDWCIDRARSLGRRRIVICSQPSMTAAHRLYLGRGFVRRPELDWSPVPEVTLLGFSRDLP
jgi:GNAT superfamily N-acetyltransferase